MKIKFLIGTMSNLKDRIRSLLNFLNKKIAERKTAIENFKLENNFFIEKEQEILKEFEEQKKQLEQEIFLIRNSMKEKQNHLNKEIKENEEKDQLIEQKIEELEKLKLNYKTKVDEQTALLLKNKTFKQKARNLKEEQMKRNGELNEHVEFLKKYTKIDFLPEKNNQLKVEFINLGYVLLDFQTADIIVDVEPKIKIDRFKYLLSEREDFFVFLKEIREAMLNF